MKLFDSDTNSGMSWKISDWFGMNFNPKLFNSNQSEVHSKSIQTCNTNESVESELIRINPNESRSIRINPNDSEKFGIFRIILEFVSKSNSFIPI